MVGRRRSQTSRLVLNKPPTVLIINIIDPIGFRPSVLPFSVPPNPALSSPNSLRRILSCRVPSGWTMPRGRPQASWLRQVESYLRHTGMAGLTSAWAMARRRRKEYRRKVDAATCCSDVCPPYLTWLGACVSRWRVGANDKIISYIFGSAQSQLGHHLSCRS